MEYRLEQFKRFGDSPYQLAIAIRAFKQIIDRKIIFRAIADHDQGRITTTGGRGILMNTGELTLVRLQDMKRLVLLIDDNAIVITQIPAKRIL